jgi:hypothetical protein
MSGIWGATRLSSDSSRSAVSWLYRVWTGYTLGEAASGGVRISGLSPPTSSFVAPISRIGRGGRATSVTFVVSKLWESGDVLIEGCATWHRLVKFCSVSAPRGGVRDQGVRSMGNLPLRALEVARRSPSRGGDAETHVGNPATSSGGLGFQRACASSMDARPRASESTAGGGQFPQRNLKNIGWRRNGREMWG